MDEINGFKIVPDARRNRVVDRPESGDSGEILAPLNARVNVQHRELPLSKLRENPLLQVLLQNLNAHKPRWINRNHKLISPNLNFSLKKKLIKKQEQDLSWEWLVTGEEFSDNAKDLAALFVFAFDLEDLQFLQQLFLFSFWYGTTHCFFFLFFLGFLLLVDELRVKVEEDKRKKESR